MGLVSRKQFHLNASCTTKYQLFPLHVHEALVLPHLVQSNYHQGILNVQYNKIHQKLDVADPKGAHNVPYASQDLGASDPRRHSLAPCVQAICEAQPTDQRHGEDRRLILQGKRHMWDDRGALASNGLPNGEGDAAALGAGGRAAQMLDQLQDNDEAPRAGLDSTGRPRTVLPAR